MQKTSGMLLLGCIISLAFTSEAFAQRQGYRGSGGWRGMEVGRGNYWYGHRESTLPLYYRMSRPDVIRYEGRYYPYNYRRLDYNDGPVAGYAVYPSNYSGQYVSGAATNAMPTSSDAIVTMQLPSADAELWFDGTASPQRGALREFRTPAIEPGKKYSYELKARWTENGQVVERNRKVTFEAGQSVLVDFREPTAPTNSGPDIPK